MRVQESLIFKIKINRGVKNDMYAACINYVKQKMLIKWCHIEEREI